MKLMVDRVVECPSCHADAYEGKFTHDPMNLYRVCSQCKDGGLIWKILPSRIVYEPPQGVEVGK